MDGPTATLQRPFHPVPRHIQPQPPHAFQQPPVHAHSALAPQLESELQGLDHADAHAYSPQFHTQFDETPSRQVLHSTNAFDQRQPQPQPRFTEIRANALHTPRNQQSNAVQHPAGQFGILTPHPSLPSQLHLPNGLQNEQDLFPSPEQNGAKEGGHFSNMKFVPDPPNLEEWRTRLFNVDDTMTLTEDEYGNPIGLLVFADLKPMVQVPDLLPAR